jgi:hypothetical protein
MSARTRADSNPATATASLSRVASSRPGSIRLTRSFTAAAAEAGSGRSGSAIFTAARKQVESSSIEG